MVNKKHIELFYDYFDAVADILYHRYSKTYIEGMNEAFNYLLDGHFSATYQEEDIDKIALLKESINTIQFEREEVRRGVQLGLLKGYKHAFESNSLITPDSIGIFIGYLTNKLYQNKEINHIFDPVVGSGNLLYTVANQLTTSPVLSGVDNELLKCEIARNIGDLLDYQNQFYCQETTTYYGEGYDVVVADLPINETEDYLPFKIILHHLDGLVDGGYFFAVIDNDFFEQKGNEVFKEEVSKKAHIFGLIKLSESLFKANPKSILILRKKGKNVTKLNDFLLVDLPSFSDMQAVNITIDQINEWFRVRKDDL